MSSGLFLNTRKISKYEVPSEPAESFINRDPYHDWAGFGPPSLSSFKAQPAPIKYGQKFHFDNPLGQPAPGQLVGPRILAPVVYVPKPVNAVAAEEASANLEQSGTGNGVRRTYAVPPNQQEGHTTSPPAQLFF